MSDVIKIEARQFVDPSGRIVESATRLADEVARQLALHDVVAIDFRGMRGLSSSYFNVLIQRVVHETTPTEFLRRIQPLFDSSPQQQVFNRSLDFASRTVA